MATNKVANGHTLVQTLLWSFGTQQCSGPSTDSHQLGHPFAVPSLSTGGVGQEPRVRCALSSPVCTPGAASTLARRQVASRHHTADSLAAQSPCTRPALTALVCLNCRRHVTQHMETPATPRETLPRSAPSDRPRGRNELPRSAFIKCIYAYICIHIHIYM